MKLLAVLVFCTLSIAPSVIGKRPKRPLQVTLYYESYCPDCIQYIQKNLLNAWTSFKSHIWLELVPFGNAKQSYVDGHFKFSCQHGLKECLANKLHACAIYQACGKSSMIGCDVNKQSQVINYINCVVSQPNQMTANGPCAIGEQLEPNGIMECANNDVGNALLSFYGNLTAEFTPQIRYVPTVAIDGKHDTAAEDDLVKEICKLKPAICMYPDPFIVQV